MRALTTLLAAAQGAFGANAASSEAGRNPADPYMTLVGYFNSIRELGGMRRLIDDDIRSRVRKMDRRGMAKRTLGTDAYDELTSRKSAADIPRINVAPEVSAAQARVFPFVLEPAISFRGDHVIDAEFREGVGIGGDDQARDLLADIGAPGIGIGEEEALAVGPAVVAFVVERLVLLLQCEFKSG